MLMPPDSRTADTAPLPLGERPVGRFDPASVDTSPGRRLRAFASLVAPAEAGLILSSYVQRDPVLLTPVHQTTYHELLAMVEQGCDGADARDRLAHLPLRVGPGPLVRALPEGETRTRQDPDLHQALQDLADEINEDIREALDALDNPHHYYPGVDEGIDPVSDDHVNLVIWALQRELDRELRTQAGSISSEAVLPSAPLASLPWHVQRSLAERRRWRFAQWGIGRKQWELGVWSLWDIPSDPDYVPRRSARLAA